MVANKEFINKIAFKIIIFLPLSIRLVLGCKDNKLIIRIAYDTTALIDDIYANDNWQFLKLMYDTDENSIPKTYINDEHMQRHILSSRFQFD